jgi:hypothetical protein
MFNQKWSRMENEKVKAISKEIDGCIYNLCDTRKYGELSANEIELALRRSIELIRMQKPTKLERIRAILRII